MVLIWTSKIMSFDQELNEKETFLHHIKVHLILLPHNIETPFLLMTENKIYLTHSQMTNFSVCRRQFLTG